MYLGLALIAPSVQCSDPEEVWAYTETVHVNNLYLYNLAFGGGYSSKTFTDTGLRNILDKIFSKHHVSGIKVNVPPIAKILSRRLKRMYSTLVGCKGFWARQKVLERWTNSTYELNLPHKTGTPTKRKLESQLDQEKCKRTKLEADLTKQMEENEELARVNHRLKQVKNTTNGVRGRSKGKKEVSKSQKYRRKQKDVENVKETMTLLLGDAVKAKRR